MGAPCGDPGGQESLLKNNTGFKISNIFQAPEIKTKMNNRDLFFNFVTRSPTIETFMFSEQ
jgi:hypothetical protein